MAIISEASTDKSLGRHDLTGPALRTFYRFAEAWGLKEQEQMRLLGLVSRSTFQSWKRGAVAAVPKDTMERISYILGIYKGLQILLPNTADQWILNLKKAGIFGGRSAIERMNDILWEVSSSLGADLAGDTEPHFHAGEVTAYELVDGRMRIVDVTCRSEMEGLQPIWVDVLSASKAERGWIARHFGVDLPDPEDVTDLEVSARFYQEENDEVHLHSDFLLDREDQSRSVPVAFIVHANTLFSIRSAELPVFRLQRLRMRSQPGDVLDCKDLLLALYAADVEYSADSLENTYATLRQVGKKVLSENVSDTDAARILSDIAEEEDLNGRIRGNMLDTQRAVSFLVRGKFLSVTQLEDAREIIRDIESLNSHTAFLFEKINFLMDATVGFININQNKRVSQLTVAGVVFMPLNVLAGVGGMSEFSMMTKDIPWQVAYGAFMAGMIAVGWGTYVMLKFYENRKGRKR